MLRLLAAAAPAMARSPPPPFSLLAAASLHQRAGGTIAPPPSDDPWLSHTDGVAAEGRHLRRLGVGGIGGANMAAIDPALAAGAPSLPFRHVVRDAPITDQQKMSTEQDVIAAADESPTTAEWLPQRTP